MKKSIAKVAIIVTSCILIFVIFTMLLVNRNVGKPIGKTGISLSEIEYAELYCTAFWDKTVIIGNKNEIQLLLNCIEESNYKRRIIHMPWYQAPDGAPYYEITFYSNDRAHTFGFGVDERNKEKQLITVGSTGNPQNELIRFDKSWLLESNLYNEFNRLYNS